MSGFSGNGNGTTKGKVLLRNGEERNLSFLELESRVQNYLRNHSPNPEGLESGERKELVSAFREEFLEHFPELKASLSGEDQDIVTEAWMKSGAKARRIHRARMNSKKGLAPTSF